MAKITGMKLDTKELDRIRQHLKTGAEEICVDLAFQIEARSKQFAPVKTGALRSSIYVVSRRKNGYVSAAAAARARNFRVSPTPIPVPDGKVLARVGPSVEYGAAVELGTSRKAARPFLWPAVQTILYLFNSGETWKKLVGK